MRLRSIGQKCCRKWEQSNSDFDLVSGLLHLPALSQGVSIQLVLCKRARASQSFALLSYFTSRIADIYRMARITK
jgi:hypothetical protein